MNGVMMHDGVCGSWSCCKQTIGQISLPRKVSASFETFGVSEACLGVPFLTNLFRDRWVVFVLFGAEPCCLPSPMYSTSLEDLFQHFFFTLSLVPMGAGATWRSRLAGRMASFPQTTSLPIMWMRGTPEISRTRFFGLTPMWGYSSVFVCRTRAFVYVYPVSLTTTLPAFSTCPLFDSLVLVFFKMCTHLYCWSATSGNFIVKNVFLR